MGKFLLKGFSLFLGALIHGLYQLRAWSLRSPKTAATVYFVLLLHCSLLLLATLTRETPKERPSSRQIAVRTFEEKASPLSRPKSVVSVSSQKKPSSKSPKPQAKTSAAKNREKKKQILEELDKSLAKMEQDKPIKKAPMPKLPQPIFSQTEKGSDLAHQYQTQLISYLQEKLSLPKIGDVKIKLLMQSDGKVLSCEILSASSEENALYLKNKLSLLQIPCFNRSLISADELSFIITFSGE